MNSQMLVLGQETIFYSITFSDRKTLAIRISEEGELEVRAPKRMKQKDIESFLLEKKEWILKYYGLAQKKQEKSPLFEWKDGEEISIAGKSYRLCVKYVHGAIRDVVRLCEESIIISTADVSQENIKESVTLWFKKACKPLIEYRASYFAQKMGVGYKRITLKEQKKCWGSCSSKDNINLNWKILLMPPDIMDYVIVHELSHLKEMNHSQAFWNIVGRELPDYKKRRKWLKDNGYFYSRI